MKRPATDAPIRCAIYARVSSDEQVDKYGLGAQLHETRKAATDRGYTVVGAFVEPEGMPVKVSMWDRPQLTKLRDLVDARGVDVVLMVDQDRLTRGGTLDFLLIARELRKHGARLEYLTFTPADTDEGRLQEQLLASFAQYERAKIVRRTSRGSREKARRGSNPNGRAPYGYRRDPSAVGGLAVDPTTAAVVVRIFAAIAGGDSIRSLTKRLDAQGIAAPHGGARWCATTVRNIIRSDVYIGTGTYNRTDWNAGRTVRDEADWIRYAVTPIPDLAPALVERARQQLQRNKSLLAGRPPGRLFLLGGLLVCGKCGRRMHGDTKDPRRPVASARYRCVGRGDADNRCQHSRQADALDGRFWTALVTVIKDPDSRDATAKASRLGIHAERVSAQQQHAELVADLTKATKARDRLLDLFVAGRLDQADLDAREPQLKAEIARLRHAIDAVALRLKAGQADAAGHAAMVAYCALVAKGIDKLDPTQRQQFVRQVVTRVVVQDDRLDVEGVFPLFVPTDPARKQPREITGGELFSAAADTEQYPLRITVPLAGAS